MNENAKTSITIEGTLTITNPSFDAGQFAHWLRNELGRLGCTVTARLDWIDPRDEGPSHVQITDTGAVAATYRRKLT